MKPGCTCLSHKEGLIKGNGREKIKNAHVLPREPFLKGCCMWFSLIQVGQSFKCLVHLVIQSLANSTRILYWRKWKFYNKKRPSNGWSGVHILHDNASSHEVVKSFLKRSPCDFFLFPRLKKMLSGSKYTSRSSHGSAINQCLQQIPK